MIRKWCTFAVLCFALGPFSAPFRTFDASESRISTGSAALAAPVVFTESEIGVFPAAPSGIPGWLRLPAVLGSPIASRPDAQRAIELRGATNVAPADASPARVTVLRL